jgi:hypothetical protein
MQMTLEDKIVKFIDNWAPKTPIESRTEFVTQLRAVLEAYGRAAIQHESLPDTDHMHGDPV